MITKLIMFLCHLEYKKMQRKNKRHVILWIKGTEKDFPKYALYTENERVRDRMEEFWED